MIGEIHACPKCGGMVLIQPPAGWSEAAGGAAASASAVTKASIVAAPQPLVGQSFHEIADLSGLDLTTPAGQVAAPVPVEGAANWSRWIVWGSAAGSVAIATASLVWALWPGDGAQVVRSAVGVASGDNARVGDDVAPNDLQAGQSVVEEPTATIVNKPAVDVAAPTPKASEEVALPEPPLAVVEVNPVREAKAENTELATAGDAGAVAIPEPSAEPAPLPVIDPRDVDPENLDLVLRKNPANGPPVEGTKVLESEKASELPISSNVDGNEDATLANLEQALEAAAKDAEPETVRRGPTSADDLPPINVVALLKGSIPEIDVPRLPLHRAVAMLTELTAIPITLDPAALRMAGVSPNQEVAIRGKNVTAEDLIRSTLGVAKLQFEQRGNQLIVVRTGADKVGERDYRVEDLLPPGTTGAESVAKLLHSMVSPESWDGQGGNGKIVVDESKLKVTQSQAVHYDALIFCERLRKARGLKLQSKYPVDLLRTKPLETALAPTLDRRTTFSFVTWTPLLQVVRHWERESKLTILVDWSALADVQLAPASTIACAVEGVSWREALDAVLEPLGLAWVPVDETTMQITSRAAAEAHEYVDFYPVASGDSEALATQLRESMPDGGTIVPDGASRSLIVRANSAGHRHIATQLSLVGDEQ